MKHSLGKLFNYDRLFIKFLSFGIFSIMIFISSFTELNVLNAEDKTEKSTVFLSFDINAFNEEEDFLISKDIILQISNYFLLDSTKTVILQGYGQTNFNPISLTKQNLLLH